MTTWLALRLIVIRVICTRRDVRRTDGLAATKKISALVSPVLAGVLSEPALRWYTLTNMIE
jgi:hypothetical protein